MPEAATNGATPQNAGQPVAPGSQVIVKPTGTAPAGATVTPPAPVEPKAPEADARLKELEAQTKRFAQQQRKFSEEKQAVEKRAAELEARAREYEEWKQHHADRLRNPAKYLEKDYGPEWYDKLTAVRLNGAPTGDLIASEIDSTAAKFSAELKKRDEELAKLRQEISTKEQNQAIESFHHEVASEIKRNIEKYPGIDAFSDDPSVWQSIRAEIDGHFQKNSQLILDGEMQMLTADEAANIVSKRIEDFGKRFETYRSKKTQPVATPPAAGITPPQRRTLSTDMTASSGGAIAPAKDDKERFERARAAMEAVRKK
jgi:hypothetical protein